jgi:hypothetical protein
MPQFSENEHSVKSKTSVKRSGIYLFIQNIENKIDI